MQILSSKRNRFHQDVISYAVWLYYRFTLSLRDVEEFLSHRGLDFSYNNVRCLTNNFGPTIAANIRRLRAADIDHVPDKRPCRRD